MRDKLSRGSITEPVIILVSLIIMVLLASMSDGNTANKGPTEDTEPWASGLIRSERDDRERTSSFSRGIRLGRGNAPYSYQPNEEYITITNSGKESVNITGWRLENGASQRIYDRGQGPTSDPNTSATIPQATLYIPASGRAVMQSIVLEPREKAIVTTGNPAPIAPYNITSFKENVCSGYLERSYDYDFTPSLSMSCPNPEDEPGAKSLGKECTNFIEGMRSCRIPEFDTRDENGDICTHCADRRPLTSTCVNYLKATYSYNSCLASHLGDPDFSLNTWRIFLGVGWEMWAEDDETISLYDQYGRLVDSISY